MMAHHKNFLTIEEIGEHFDSDCESNTSDTNDSSDVSYSDAEPENIESEPDEFSGTSSDEEVNDSDEIFQGITWKYVQNALKV
jgi:hypothetical protein